MNRVVVVLQLWAARTWWRPLEGGRADRATRSPSAATTRTTSTTWCAAATTGSAPTATAPTVSHSLLLLALSRMR